MKTLYLTYFRYDETCELNVQSISETESDGRENWKHDGKDFVCCGPDDVSELYFIKINLEDDVVKELLRFWDLGEDILLDNLDWYNFLEEKIEPVFQSDDCEILDSLGDDSVYDPIRLYMTNNGLNPDDSEEFEKYCDFFIWDQPYIDNDDYKKIVDDWVEEMF